MAVAITLRTEVFTKHFGRSTGRVGRADCSMYSPLQPHEGSSVTISETYVAKRDHRHASIDRDLEYETYDSMRGTLFRLMDLQATCSRDERPMRSGTPSNRSARRRAEMPPAGDGRERPGHPSTVYELLHAVGWTPRQDRRSRWRAPHDEYHRFERKSWIGAMLDATGRYGQQVEATERDGETVVRYAGRWTNGALRVDGPCHALS